MDMEHASRALTYGQAYKDVEETGYIRATTAVKLTQAGLSDSEIVAMEKRIADGLYR